MRRLLFTFPSGGAISNTLPIAPNLLCGLYVPTGLAGALLTLEGAFADDPTTFYTVDRSIDLSTATNKSLMHTQWQNNTCGIDLVRLRTDTVQVSEISCVGGLLLV